MRGGHDVPDGKEEKDEDRNQADDAELHADLENLVVGVDRGSGGDIRGREHDGARPGPEDHVRGPALECRRPQLYAYDGVLGTTDCDEEDGQDRP